MNGRRLYAPVVLATLVGGGGAFFAASRTWVSATVDVEGLPGSEVTVTGTEAQPLVPALALIVVTAVLAVLASSPRVRRVVGVLLMAVALGGALLVLFGGTQIDDAVRSAVHESPSFTGSNYPESTDSTIWRPVAGLGFALAAVLGALVVRYAHQWPTMGSRYDAPRAHRPKAQPQSETDMWKALDEGQDPTE